MQKEKSDSKSPVKKVVCNTVFLYFRSFLIMLIIFYITRLLLQILGIENYGISNVVGSIVSMLSFITNPLQISISRFYNVELGKGDFVQLENIFRTTDSLYVLLAVAFFVFFETGGLWIFKTKLVIPEGRVLATFWFYQFIVISFLFTILTTPLSSLVISHENMNVYAFFSIGEYVAKLSLILLLKYISFDKLIGYGVLLCAVSVINFLGYLYFCKRNYREVCFRPNYDWSRFRTLFSYAIWNIWGGVGVILSTVFLNIILNNYFGAVVNAARSVAIQVLNAVSLFSCNLSVASVPQITQLYSQKKYDDCYQLVFRISKYIFFMFLLIAAPALGCIDFLLKIWLKTEPEYTTIFARLAIIQMGIDIVSYPLMTLVQASGRIRLYQSLMGAVLFMHFPISWWLLQYYHDPSVVYYVGIGISTVSIFIRLWILKRIMQFAVKDFFKRVLARVGLSSLCLPLLFLLIPGATTGWGDLFFKSASYGGGAFIFIVVLGLTKAERNSIILHIQERYKKVFLKC